MNKRALNTLFLYHIKYMKKTAYIFLMLISYCAIAQELTVPTKFLTNYKTGTEQYIGTDAFGAVYTLQDNELHKSKEGVMLKYKALALGSIAKTDLQNPLQIVLFYRKFNSVVLLDNQLNEIRRINFSDIAEPLIAEAIGLASQNRLWLYDITTQRLGLYDLAQNTFKPITPPFADTIKQYQSDYNYFYWIDINNKCFAANLFGKVTLLGNVPPYDGVQLASPTEAIVQHGNSLYLYNMHDGSRKKIDIAEKTFEGFQYSAQILSIFTNEQINQYKITVSQ